MSWSPIWTQIVDSSLWHEPYFVRVLFTSMMALKDKNFMVLSDTFKLSSRLHMPESDVIKGLEILKAPDTRRAGPQPFEGRRIQEVEGGWFILNAEKYRDMIGKEKNKASKAEWMARDREQKKFFESLNQEQRQAYLKAFGITSDQLRKDGRPTATAMKNAVKKLAEQQKTDEPSVFDRRPPDYQVQKMLREDLAKRNGAGD